MIPVLLLILYGVGWTIHARFFQGVCFVEWVWEMDSGVGANRGFDLQVTERDGGLDYGFYDMTCFFFCFFYILFSVVTLALTKRIIPIKPPKRLHPHLYTKTQKKEPKGTYV